MTDYTKNLTEQVSPAYGNVQYTFDAIGDTQGDAALPNLACHAKMDWQFQIHMLALRGCQAEHSVRVLQVRRTLLPRPMIML